MRNQPLKICNFSTKAPQNNHQGQLMRSKFFAIAASLVCAHASAYEAPSIDTCNTDAFQSTLHAAPGAFEARAVWLNRQLAKWPGASSDGTFKLYHSRNGAITATPGARVAGADGALALSIATDATPADAAARFRYVGNGPVLAVGAGDIERLPSLHRHQLVLVQEAVDGSVRAAARLQAAGAIDDQIGRAHV